MFIINLKNYQTKEFKIKWTLNLNYKSKINHMLEKNSGRQKRLYYHKKQIYEHYLKPKYTHNKFYNVHTRKRSSNSKNQIIIIHIIKF